MAAADAGAARAFAKIFDLRGASRLEGGRETEENSGDDGDEEGEEEDAGVDGDFVEAGDVGGGESEDGAFEEEHGEESDGAGEEGEEGALCEHLADEPRARSAHGEADGDFAAASGGAREEKIGDVDAGDEEDEGDGAEEDEEFGALRADEVFFNGDEADGPAGGGGIFFGIRARELRDVGVDLMLGLRDGEAWFKAADGAGKKTLRAIGRNRKWRASESGGEPDVDIGIESAAGMTEVGRHDADDGVEVGIEAHFAAETVGGGAGGGVPESVGDNDGIEEGGDGVLGSVNAAEFGLGAEESEVVGTGEEAFGANGAVTTADGGV